MFIFSAIAVSTSMFFAALYRHVWGGFVYFVLTLLSVLALMWGIFFILQYVSTFKSEVEQQYEIYVTEKITQLKISKEEYLSAENEYKKDFKRKILFQRLTKWVIIAICFAVAAGFVWAMFLIK